MQRKMIFFGFPPVLHGANGLHICSTVIRSPFVTATIRRSTMLILSRFIKIITSSLAICFSFIAIHMHLKANVHQYRQKNRFGGVFERKRYWMLMWFLWNFSTLVLDCMFFALLVGRTWHHLTCLSINTCG